MICHFLHTKAMELFPESHLTVVGGFIFLRFFTPAIMTPHLYGIVEGSFVTFVHHPLGLLFYFQLI
jgi:hypothetical protein